MRTAEFFTEEGCFITELHNSADDPAVSVARARVEPGVRTALHTLTMDERYLIEQGAGLASIGDRSLPVAPGDVVHIPAGTPQRIENTGTTDLVFLCVCTPRFEQGGYRTLEPRRDKPAIR